MLARAAVRPFLPHRCRSSPERRVIAFSMSEIRPFKVRPGSVAGNTASTLAGFAVSSVARGVSAPDSERGGRRGFSLELYHFCIILRHGVRSLWIDRSRFYMCTCGERPSGSWGVGQVAGPRRGDSGQKPGDFRRGFGFEFGLWLAVSTEPLRSRSLYGVRTRDECTKRTSWSGIRGEGREQD